MSRAPSGASFQRKLTWAFLIVGVIPLLICLLLLLNIFRLSLVRSDRSSAESQLSAMESGFGELLEACAGALEDLGQQGTVAQALQGQEDRDTRIYNALYDTAAPLLREADFSLYDGEGALCYTTGSGGAGETMPVNWGLLAAAREQDGVVYRAVSPYDRTSRGRMQLVLDFSRQDVREHHLEKGIEGRSA